MYELNIPMTENGKESFLDAFDTTKNKFAPESFVHEQIQNLCKYYDSFMENLEMKIPIPTSVGGRGEVILTLKEANLGELGMDTNSNWVPAKFKENDMAPSNFSLKISSGIERKLVGFAKIYTRRIQKHNESIDKILNERFSIPPSETEDAKKIRLKNRESEEKIQKLTIPSCVEEAVFLTLIDAIKAKREEGTTKAMQQDFKEFYPAEKPPQPKQPKK